MKSLLVASVLLATAYGSVWPYHESVGLVSDNDGIIAVPAHRIVPAVNLGSNVATAHASSVSAGPASEPVVIKGPLSSAVRIAGPSERTYYLESPYRASYRVPYAVVGPTERPVAVSSAQSSTYGSSASASASASSGHPDGAVLVDDPAISPILSGPILRSSSGATADARAYASGAPSALASASSGPVSVLGPVGSPVLVKGAVASSSVIDGSSSAPVVIREDYRPVTRCPPEVDLVAPRWPAGRPTPIAISTRPAPIAIAGPSPGSVSISGPSVPATVISGPSGTITTGGSYPWDFNRRWVPAYSKW
ncbi:signaling mucin HKR1 [Orussus abietinus]|uniref:signaling mucin HKR1 n=1 Tax=Orussus abietinus TaxID=222816 RepID=UPI0006258096|nr:signaling mucin HKR1 [Orussus abietinus]